MKSRRAARFATAATALGAMLIPFSPGVGSPPGPPVSGGVATPSGWRREASPGPIPNAGAYTVALPPEVMTIPAEGVDSYVSEYRSKSLRLVFDFGGYGSSGVEECRRHAASCSIDATMIGGMRAIRASYYEKDPDGELPYRVSYYIPFGPPSPPPTPPARGPISLKISAECATAAACALADRIAKTIDILRDR